MCDAYGDFTGPYFVIDDKNTRAEFVKMWKKQPHRDLPFRFGYPDAAKHNHLMIMRPKALIFDEPTRGVDVGAKQEIYEMLRHLADAGVAILMISSDMEEVIGVSDRIAVMHEGAISGFLDRSQFSEHNVLQLAVGHAV